MGGKITMYVGVRAGKGTKQSKNASNHRNTSKTWTAS